MLIANSVRLWTQTTVLAAEQTFAIDDKTFYDNMKKCLTTRTQNIGALLDSDDDNQTIKLDMEKVGEIKIEDVDMTGGNSKNILETLFRECTNLKVVNFKDCNINGISFSDLNNKALTEMYLVNCGIRSVPGLSLPYLDILCLSQNDLSAEDAFENLTGNNFPALTRLWLDECKISNVDFIEKLGDNIVNLSLADNELTNTSLDDIIAAGNTKLRNLKVLGLGARVHAGSNVNIIYNSNGNNKITNIDKLSSLPEIFTDLVSLDISCLRITSLQPFANFRDNVAVDFTRNLITDFTGIETRSNWDLNHQFIHISGNFAAGLKSELPEILKRVTDENDILKGDLSCTNCSLSDDGAKIEIAPNKNYAEIKVTSGRLKDSFISFTLKRMPVVPNDLKAKVGDTLAKVILPEGFTWKDASLSVGPEGTKTFKAAYTPVDTDTYVYVDDIDVPVMVEAADDEQPSKPSGEEPSSDEQPTKPADDEESTKPSDEEHETEPSGDEQPTKPAVDGNETEGSAGADSSVNTFDATPVVPVMVILLVSCMILYITVLVRKKQCK